ncbi:hypothetical protein [Salinibacillus kushneri]|uniref:hypothetical protein n=1 Tax=Salinibacillus kushneri TaxID=237682 RepID=UPI0015A681C4|nr:hypothetical protein [Salinibacillus kushneri]
MKHLHILHILLHLVLIGVMVLHYFGIIHDSIAAIIVIPIFVYFVILYSWINKHKSRDP